ncbi:uncharacterized protein HaLaN_21392 [Haematococcus lacustris]|uniref:Uncharacterized protein n=1 Tax=Haematococcus lacustris TaxID=44745 RepID=A0A699ZM44_HAELA|nr:uncharacterized protein HaLaN_21392 [Haematococcus lacustris]
MRLLSRLSCLAPGSLLLVCWLQVYAVAAGLSVVMLWRASCWLSSTSALMSRNLAEWGLLSLAVSLVLLGAQYLRWRSAIHPAAVYRAAMMRLHASPAVLEAGASSA